MSDKKTRKVSGSVIASMKQANWLRTDRYALFAGFAGVYSIDNVVELASGTATVDNNFRVQCTGAKKVTIPGSVLANARLISTAINGKSIDKADDVYYSDDIQDVLNQSQPYHEAEDMNGEGYEFPEELEIVGAVVNKFEDHPYIPLRKYLNYSTCLKYHQKDTKNDKAYLTREIFSAILALEGEARPKDLPADAKTMQLPESTDVTDMKHWSFTLLIKKVK